MRELVIPVRKGLIRAGRIIVMMAVVVVPVSGIIALLEAYLVLDYVASFFQPVLKHLGLPGETALPLSLGFFVSFYASLGAVEALFLTTREVTLVGVMVLIAHDLFAECAVCRLAGWSFWKPAFLRLAVALSCGALVNLACLMARWGG